MTQSGLIRPQDALGSALDASFAVKEEPTGFSIYFAARGGTKGSPEARNTEYHKGLTVLLARLADLNASLDDALLDSALARKHPIDLRRLALNGRWRLPQRMGDVSDIDRFRRDLCESQRDVLTTAGRDRRHGNRVRSIRLWFSLPPELAHYSLSDVERALVSCRELDQPTADFVELERRAAQHRKRRDRTPLFGNPNPCRVVLSGVERFERLPGVVFHTLERSSGQCELCLKKPFLRDDGVPFLEVHHVRQLAEGGPDTIDNAVALCPDCHRELHFGAERERRRLVLFERIPTLVDYPAR